MEKRYQLDSLISDDLKEKAKEIRRRTIMSLYHAQSGHPGPSLSWADLCSVLYFYEMNLKGSEMERDRFILSKGHGAATQYAALSIKFPGILPKEKLETLRQLGSPLQGHPVKGTLPYIDASTGSLGQGLSIAIGYALAFKRKKQDFRRAYVVLGDGECQEGQVWEAFMCGAKFNLDNLVAIIDSNKYQNESSVSETMPLDPLKDKLTSFGWNVYDVDGHNLDEIVLALEAARMIRKPSAIIANTVKGKGVSFMEGDMGWHSRAIKENEYNAAMEELNGAA